MPEPTPRADPAPLVLVTGHAFGVRAFEGIFASPAFLDGELTVPLMVGLDDSRAGATVGYVSPRHLAAEQDVSYAGTADGRLTSLADQIRAASPAYILVIGWSRLIPDEVLAIPAQACIGMHPTRLPHGRGQAPIPWTIIKGGRDTALSVFFLEAAADTGPVIAQYGLEVHPAETGASLFYRLAQTHFTAGYELAPALARREVRGRVQDESGASRWPKRRPADGEIRDTMTVAEADALVRALLGPYPRAFVTGPRYIRAVALADGPGRIPFTFADGPAWLIPDESYRPG